MKLINILSVFSSLINLVLNCVLGFFFGVFGIAAASSIACLSGNILQLVFIKRFISTYKLREVLSTFFPTLVVGILTFFIFFYLKTDVFQYNQQYRMINKILYLGINLVAFSIVFFILCLILKVEVVIEFSKKTLKKIKR